MNHIRPRLILLTVFCLSIIGAFGFLTFGSFQQYASLENNLSDSYEVVDIVIGHSKKNLEDDDMQEWLKKADDLQPAFRGEALRSALKNPSSANVGFLLKSENEYRKYINPLITYFYQRVFFWGAAVIGASLFFTFGVLIFVLQFLFSPIKELSRKMWEFLHNRYTYEFSAPEPNEIGELQSTFNNLAQKVLSQIDDLKALDNAKSEFLSIASHELRTPLTSIKGSLSLLNSGIMGAINEQAKNLMGIALEETDRLIRLINELLDLAKIEARQFPLTLEWVSAQDLIDKTFQGLAGFCQASGVKLAADDCSQIELQIDRDRLQQVFTNLLSNAVKYSPKGETVRVAFVPDEKYGLRIEVSDKGRGIAPQDQEIIFEKFRQAASPQNPLVKGTGLGLAIAKALVEQHGGIIGVRSKPGEGSTFYFTLPKWRPHRNMDKTA